jgi:hypothetical protein
MDLSVAYRNRIGEAIRPRSGVEVVTNDEDPDVAGLRRPDGGGALLLGKLARWQVHREELPAFDELWTGRASVHLIVEQVPPFTENPRHVDDARSLLVLRDEVGAADALILISSPLVVTSIYEASCPGGQRKGGLTAGETSVRKLWPAITQVTHPVT